MDGWMSWLSPGLPAPPLAPKSEVMTECIPEPWLGKAPIAGVHCSSGAVIVMWPK